jgi:hypothetical protein
MSASISSGPIKYWWNYITTFIERNYEIQEVILIATISDLDNVIPATVDVWCWRGSHQATAWEARRRGQGRDQQPRLDLDSARGKAA